MITRVLLTSLLLGLSLKAHNLPKDVLMIAIDDLRPMLGCYGDTRIQTPNIDKLAERGVVFEKAYCQYAKCGTSRLSMMTGLRPNSIGVFSNNKRDLDRFRKRRPDAFTMARWFRNLGYDVRGLGKIQHDGWDLASDWSVPPSPGRDREMWEIVDEKEPMKPTLIADRVSCPVIQAPDVPDNHLFAGRMTDKVIAYMNKPTSEYASRFLAVGYRRPHLPFVAPKRYFDLYQPDESWLGQPRTPSPEAPIMAWFNSDGYVGMSRKQNPQPMPFRPRHEEAIAWNGYELRSYLGVPTHGRMDLETEYKLLQAYAACVSYVDAQIGRLLEGLKKSGRAKETIVVLWSDHGWHLGEHSAWGKMTNYEIATRVPLIIAGPGIQPGRTKCLAELVDLYPTLCELVDREAPAHLQGESLVPALKAPKKLHQKVALSQYSRFQDKYMGKALRTERYRFVQWREQSSKRVVHQELYDHNHDSREAKNLANDPKHAQLVKGLEAKLHQAFQENP